MQKHTNLCLCQVSSSLAKLPVSNSKCCKQRTLSLSYKFRFTVTAGVCVLLCFIKLMLGNRYGLWVSSEVMVTLWRSVGWTKQSDTHGETCGLLSCCLLSAEGSLSPYQSTSSKYCCISCRCFYDSPCTTRINTWTLCSPFDVAHILIAGGITTNAFSL